MFVGDKRLVDKYKLSKEIKDIGFSGHHKGIALDVVAYSLKLIMLNDISLDRHERNDHSASQTRWFKKALKKSVWFIKLLN